MTLALPNGRVLQLDQALPDRLPDSLAVIDRPELVAFLGQVMAGANRSAGVTDWGNLAERMRFIADLFRTYHLTPELFDPPFDAEQMAVIRAGGRPAGKL